MTNNEITKMANEAGFVTGLVANKKPFIWHLFVEDDNLFPEMKLFAKLVANAEREACAKIISSKTYAHIPRKNQLWLLLLEILDEIKARGNT